MSGTGRARTYRLHPALRDDPVMVADFVRQMETRHGVPVKIEYHGEGRRDPTVRRGRGRGHGR